MALKIALARTAHKIERGFEKIKRGPATDNSIIDCYGGYTTPDQIVLRGRVLAKARTISAPGRQSKWRNFKDFLSLFLTDELQGVQIEATQSDARTLTDEEGFFTLRIPRNDVVPAQIGIRAARTKKIHHVPVFSSDRASYGVISDIDDTIIRTGAYSLIKNLWTSATGNVHEREVFDDATVLLQQCAGEGACFFYVSSSPWNLYDYLQAIFQKADLPLGPFFLRDLGVSDTQFITGTHGDHKTAAIKTILAANPDLSFTLVGDTGQHDPHIYASIVRDYPGRFSRVILRRPNEDELPAEVEADVAKIKAAGVTVAIDFDYRALLSEIA